MKPFARFLPLPALFAAQMLLLAALLACGSLMSHPPWRAIIAFTDGSINTEDWAWFWGDIIDACDPDEILTIYFDSSLLPDDQPFTVLIGDPSQPVAVIDLVTYIEQYRYGYLFVQEAKDSHYQPYGLSSDSLAAAAAYFDIAMGGYSP